MEKQLVITLKGEEHAEIMECNLTDEEIRDFFSDVTALLVLSKPIEYKSFKAAILSCAQTMSLLNMYLFQKAKEKESKGN